MRQRLKPTTILALDALAVRLCQAVRPRLEQHFGARGRLIQLHALAREQDILRFDSDLAAGSDAGSDPGAARAVDGCESAQQIDALFERSKAVLDAALIKILEVGTNITEVIEADAANVQIVNERVIFLVFSSAEPSRGAIPLELARRIQWLLQRRFPGELHSLHCVILLPGLLDNPGPEDYSANYALLKRVDEAITRGISPSPMRKRSLFNTCWLLDGRNARAVTIGPLADNLDAYADAFTGFLTAEPEQSGALAEAFAPRGKTPAYNSFGYGELFLPADTAVTRLSAALAQDIIARAFTPEPLPSVDERRRLLLAAKRFVLHPDYVTELTGLGRSGGKAIWQPFRPVVKLRETAPSEYIAEVRRRHEEFDARDMNQYREGLLARGEQVELRLTELLDTEIDRRADAVPDGLSEAIRLLELFTDEDLALERDLLGEEPQNLRTELRAAKSALDPRLQVVIDREATTVLLEEVHDLRNQYNSLDTDLRLASAEWLEPPVPEPAVTESGRAPEPPDSGEAGASEAGSPEGGREASRGGPEEMRAELEKIEQRIVRVGAQYRHELQREEREAERARREAVRRIEQETEEAVAQAEGELSNQSDRLRSARQHLEVVQEERRVFLRSYAMLYPFAAAVLVFVIPHLIAVADFDPFPLLVELMWDNLDQVALWTLVVALIYAAVIFVLYRRDIYPRLKAAAEQVERLVIALEDAAVRVQRAHDHQLHIKYELFEQGMRAGALVELIETAMGRAKELRGRLDALALIAGGFARQHAEVRPASSITRRPLLTVEDIDAYYAKVVTSAEAEAAAFIREWVPRSRVRRVSPEDFRAQLTQFTRQRFERLAQLSAEDALLREPDLVPHATALARLRELNSAAEPLLRLNEPDANSSHFAQRDATVWAAPADHEQVLKLYRSVSPNAQIRAAEKDRSLYVLTRCRNFPIYFIGAIEYYRDCYERDPKRDAGDLPDLIPIDPEVSRAYEQLLLCIALGIVTRGSDGEYSFGELEGGRLGADRKQIVEKLVTTYSYRRNFDTLSAPLEARLADPMYVHERLVQLLNSGEFDEGERTLLNELIRRYHPLR